jgi:energy-coupling factor transport system ATP-binding protein
MIEISGLTFTYAGASSPALRQVDLSVERGQLCAIVGANGAGKTTLCYALTGFVPHFYRGSLTGSIRLAGREVTKSPPADLVGEVGLVFQNPFNQITGARFTVREEIAFGLENLGVPRQEMVERLEEALDITGLTEVAERSPFALSGGQQQRLAIASVIAMRPRLLVLDEPTSQLDPAGTRDVFAALRAMTARGETTIVLTELKLALVAAFADRVVALAEGCVVADGEPRQILASETMQTYGIGETRYTQAARRALQSGLAPADRPLPVTLDQAVGFLR